jgi:hypothetical protein
MPIKTIPVASWKPSRAERRAYKFDVAYTATVPVGTFSEGSDTVSVPVTPSDNPEWRALCMYIEIVRKFPGAKLVAEPGDQGAERFVATLDQSLDADAAEVRMKSIPSYLS